MANVEAVLSRLTSVRQAGSGYTATCPAHPDQHASLSLSTGDDGRVLVKCFAGCRVEDITAAIDLKVADLFPEGGRGSLSLVKRSQHCNGPVGCTLTDYATAKRIPVDTLKMFGVSQISNMGAPALRMVYRQPDGTDGPVRLRTALHKTSDGDQRFAWKKGSKLAPYGLDRLAAARAAGRVTLVEGESDCHTLWFHGEPAIGLPGAATWKEPWAAHLDGIATIYVVVEPDRGGEAVLAMIAKSSIRDRVRLVTLTGHKDVSDLHVADPDAFPGAWRATREAAEAWTVRAERAARQHSHAAWARCRTLAARPDILACLDDSLTRRGVVGERRAARLVYLAATSRVLDRIVSVAVKGPSSGGKSYTVAAVLEHFPGAAYHAMTGMSERALAYSEEPLEHRMLVIYEACGMAGDFASYLIRSLLSEGRIRYEVVEKTKDGLRPRLIERAGPTGLITTTTAVSLHPENETRLLSIPVTDTPDQTRQILRALSSGARGTVDDLDDWRALQEWIETAERRVSIPFAESLAAAIPPVAVRLRRDFATLLALIKAHAILHQATRERTTDGRIVATLTDYAAVRALVVDLLDVAVAQTVAADVGHDAAEADAADRLRLREGHAARVPGDGADAVG